jgi:hypothetical protein
MPSSPGYVRDYTQERKTSLARGEREGHTLRLRARRLAIKKGMIKPHQKVDIDHKKMVSKGGTDALSNLRVATIHDNRSYQRNPDGSAKNNK